MRPRLVLVIAWLLASLIAGKVSAQGVTLTVDNVRNDSGQIIVLVFDDAEASDFLAHEWTVGYAAVPAQPSGVSHSSFNLTSGPYAIFVFHDENADWDVNSDGKLLLEGVAANGAPGAEDMPDFHAASIWPGPVSFTLHYGD